VTEVRLCQVINDKKSGVKMAFDSRLLTGVSVLTAVVESGSFARAAEALGITASGVSRAIARLEMRVGARLLERTTRTVRLSDEGRRFYESVKPSLAAIEEAAIVASGSPNVVRGRLRARVAILITTRILAGRLGALLARHPELSVEIVTDDRTGDLVADGIDVAISLGDQAPASLVSHKISETRILTVASPSYLKRYGKPDHPSELNNQHGILFRDPATGRPFAWEFHRRGKVLTVDVPTRLILNDGNVLVSECVAGTGIAQVTENTVHDLLCAGKLVNLFPDWNGELYPIYAVYPVRQHLPAKVRTFIDFVTEIFSKLG
jgi:DNA-binding transcriptional LysR family regulator